ncbi:hypothetical protein ACFFV7_38890 [Nonomuraea spiralis]|uniref:Uncharacterized protein n=1 Tax=Nonomuraea spiralis TaxID=46182 RepID=A0ABV5IRN6_9ACTN|nr:hypothetical protein [Nonomuraea spiralis]
MEFLILTVNAEPGDTPHHVSSGFDAGRVRAQAAAMTSQEDTSARMGVRLDC